MFVLYLNTHGSVFSHALVKLSSQRAWMLVHVCVDVLNVHKVGFTVSRGLKTTEKKVGGEKLDESFYRRGSNVKPPSLCC